MAGTTVPTHPGLVTLEEFGAIGDGVVDDSVAFTAALAVLAAGTRSTLRLGARTYLVSNGGVVPGGASIIGEGHSSILKTTATSPVLSLAAVNDVTLKDFHIVGNGASGTNAIGIKMGTSGVANSGPQRVTLSNIYVEGMWASSFWYARSPMTLHEGPKFFGCHAKGAVYGFRFLEQGEFATLVGCKATSNGTGLEIAAGNITWTAGDITNNTIGVNLGPGTNDAHGIVSSSNIDHNSTENVKAGAITNGHTFLGCHIYGGNITLVSSVGVRFVGCAISATTMTFDGSLGTRLLHCTFPITPTIVDDANGHPSTTQWHNCRALDGTTPGYAADRG